MRYNLFKVSLFTLFLILLSACGGGDGDGGDDAGADAPVPTEAPDGPDNSDGQDDQGEPDNSGGQDDSGEPDNSDGQDDSGEPDNSGEQDNPGDADTTPNSFSFAPVNEAVINSLVSSAAVEVTGINSATEISVSNGEYAIDGGEFTANASTIEAGQSVVLRLRASDIHETTAQATLTIGGESAVFAVTTEAPKPPPTASVHFPLSGAFTDADTITVRGRAERSGNREIAAVRVNGVEASSEDGFANWQAVVPLDPAVNTLVVETLDVNGNADTSAASVDVIKNVLLSNPKAAVLDSDNQRALLVDSDLDALLSVDLRPGESFGNVSVVSDEENGSDSDSDSGFDLPVSLALDSANNRAIVLDGGLRALVAVDLTPGETFGNRRVFADSEQDDGVPTLFSPHGVIFDSVNQRALVVDSSRDALIAVDLQEGETFGTRSIISDSNNGSGDNFLRPRALVLDRPNQRVLVADSAQDGIMAVDLRPETLGDRSVISSEFFGSGVNLRSPIALALDSVQERLLVTDSVLDALVAVDLRPGVSFGDRQVIADRVKGDGIDFVVPRSLVLDEINSRALVVDGTLDTLVAIDLRADNLGDRHIIAEGLVGSGGIDTQVYEEVVFDAVNQRAIVAVRPPFPNEDFLSGLLAIDLSPGEGFGERSMIYQSAPRLEFLRSLVLDSQGQQVLAVDTPPYSQPGALMAVSLEEGENFGQRRVIADSNNGSGIDFDQPVGLTLDRFNNRALVLDDGLDALIAVDLTEENLGNRELISDNNNLGIDFKDLASVSLDSPNNRALVVDFTQDALIAVDLTADNLGDREVISDSENGLGTNFDTPQQVVLDSVNQQALVIDSDLRALIAVDLREGGSLGDRRIISDIDNGEGTDFLFPRSVSLDSVNNQALVVDFKLNALIVVDLESGDRVVVSKSR